MTTESNDNDPRVSDAYRDLASERTPPELDRKILSMAAGNERTRYGLARAWVRPVAWAATIGLSLAFVLELSQVQDKALVAGSGSDAEAIEAPARAKSDAHRRQEFEKRSDAPAAAGVSSPPATAQQPALDRDAEAADSAAADFEADDMSIVHEAEERARLQSGSVEPAPARTEVFRLAEKKEQALSCDADARSTVETWYACIETLRESDLSELAELELESLLAEFPEFQEPDPDR